MIHATIKEIGENAVSEQEPILILFPKDYFYRKIFIKKRGFTFF